MSRKSVRRLNGGDTALAVLTADLGRVLWANTAGRALIGGRNGSSEAAGPAALRAAAEAIDARGRTQLLLRPADPALGRAVLARVERDGDALVLTARVETREGDDAAGRAVRLLREADLGADAPACVVSAVGFLAGTPVLAPAEHALLALQGAEFLQADEDHLALEDGAGALVFARVADDLVLILIEERDRERETPSAAEPTSAPAPAPAPAPSIVEAEAAPEPAAPLPATQDAAPAAVPAFRARLDAEPVRFVWQIDAEGRFSQLSPEFAATVGPHAADVVGRAFGDVSAVFGFDTSHEIERLLERRDTWSGRSVLWPIEGTDRRAPVDLAALPVFSRERRFEGFRGFGIVRPAEHVADPDAIGLALSAPEPRLPPAPREDDARAHGAGRVEPPAPARPFGRRTGEPSPPGVIALDERRRSREPVLSSDEEAAFRAIGAELAPRPAPAPPPAEPDAAPLPLRAELAALFDALPVAILVQHEDALVFGNQRFRAETGYRDLAVLEAAGGLDRLVVSCGGAEGEDSRLRHADGHLVAAGFHLQRVVVAGRSCLLMSFPPPLVDPAARAAEQRLASELEAEVAELMAVLDTATDGILLLDDEARVRRMNGSAEALFAREADRYLDRPFAELLAPASRPIVAGYLETLRDEGLASVLNDGREVEALVEGETATIPLFVTFGRLADRRGWCVVMRDMAHWKAVEGDLVAARRQAEDASFHKSRFLANISHELRTPLNAIIGFADVMASECFGPIGHERYLEYLGDIKRSGHHVLDLVNDLLDISKIEAGKMELSFEAVALDEVVSEVVALMQPQANRERVIVRSVLPPAVPAVVADRRSLRQIALNLLANAVRFTPPGGQIIASTAYGEDGEVTLRFRDSGIGMTEHEIAIALTPFQQVKAGGRGEGTGLGLPITKAMAEANQAQFLISSTPGEGTLVEIVFPAQRVLAH